MIIDRNAGVTPNRYESPWLRRTVGKRIGRADRDDMLRALLWVTEVRAADNVATAWREFKRELDRESTEAGRRRGQTSWQRSEQVAVGCHEAADKLADALWQEQQEAADAAEQCEDIAQELSTWLGVTFGDEQSELPDTRAALALLNDHLLSARQRLTELMSRDQKELHRLAKLEEKKRQAASARGTTIEMLDAASQPEFDDAIRQALQRLGYQAQSREPRVLEVTRDGATGLVFCANIQRPKYDEANDVRMILTAQRLAKASGFDGVLIVSNLKYVSRPAHRLLQEAPPSVQMMQRFELQRWIEWGMPLRRGVVPA